MEPTTMSVDKKETQKIGMKNQKEEDIALITHGQGDDGEAVHGTQHANNDSLNFNDNMGTENVVDCKCNSTKKLSRQEKAELSRKLEEALCSRRWELAEYLVMGSNVHALNEALCMSLESIWFLSTHDELNGLTTFIKTIVLSGASNFSGAIMRTSFLASFISAWQSETMSLGGAQTFVGQRLHKHLKECIGNGLFEKEDGDKVLKFTDWAMKWTEKHQGSSDPPKIFTLSEIQLQLTAFRTFLDLAETQLTISNFTEAFDAACFSLTTFYSCSLCPGWASGTSAAAVRGLLNILADRGAGNFKQCVLIASRFGCTEVVRILLQLARLKSIPVDVDLALGVAAYYARLDTMNFLVDEGQATSFGAPLLTASQHGCIPVISWFINRGCSDRELRFALSSAASYNQLEAAIFLLPKVPLYVLTRFSTDILKATAEDGRGSLDGVAFLLSANFLGSPEATYGAVERLIYDEDEVIMPELATYLMDNWSVLSFYEGMRDADDHYVNVMRVLRRGRSDVRLSELPAGMVVAIALMPLYKECLKMKGELLPQRLKGELVGSLIRLGYREVGDECSKGELIAMLESHLPSCHRSLF